MRKQHVLFAALAAAVALSASGCKSREKIDLDTLHTSEAETMASTEASGGDKEKETEKENPEGNGKRNRGDPEGSGFLFCPERPLQDRHGEAGKDVH